MSQRSAFIPRFAAPNRRPIEQGYQRACSHNAENHSPPFHRASISTPVLNGKSVIHAITEPSRARKHPRTRSEHAIRSPIPLTFHVSRNTQYVQTAHHWSVFHNS